MEHFSLEAISPIDGRYHEKTRELSGYFSESALFKYRLLVEVEYFIALCAIPLPQLKDFDPAHFNAMRSLYTNFSEDSAVRMKRIEAVTNHDVKAVEYFMKEQFEQMGISRYAEFIHFGLTSQDINNTAFPRLFFDALEDVVWPLFEDLVQKLDELTVEWKAVPMLARTHGQPASPTTLGKEFKVFAVRLQNQMKTLARVPRAAKFGGASGNFNAHHAAYPDVSWTEFANHFVNDILNLHRSHPTTQIEHYDFLAAALDNLKRINTILIDLNRDVWSYISMDYFKQKIKKDEVGSSAMPHKVNPIDFENSEGNLGLANATFDFLSSKLPVSRLQRDLTDSTVMRNLGVPVGHTLIALKSTLKGLNKLILNEYKLREDLENNWTVVAEAIQTILRREGYPKPFEALKGLTRKNAQIDQESIRSFIEKLEVPEAVKKELSDITPWNYLGIQDWE
jgi:adenylosuccinate lyase